MARDSQVHNDAQRCILVNALAITAAVSAQTSTPVTLLSGCKYLVAEMVFTYGSGGTNAKFWLQTSVDGGSNWFDIANFAATTATLRRVLALSADIAATPAVPTDGTLADNTINNGLLGNRFRIKYTTTGTYAATTVSINAIAKG